jgi:hypothetical protein
MSLVCVDEGDGGGRETKEDDEEEDEGKDEEEENEEDEEPVRCGVLELVEEEGVEARVDEE